MSEIGSTGFEEPGGTSPPRIPWSIPRAIYQVQVWLKNSSRSVSFRRGMGSKQAKYVNDSDANDASMLKDMPTHDKVNGSFQSWTVMNYRDTQQRGAYVRMFGVLWTLVSLAAVYAPSHNRVACVQTSPTLRKKSPHFFWGRGTSVHRLTTALLSKKEERWVTRQKRLRGRLGLSWLDPNRPYLDRTRDRRERGEWWERWKRKGETTVWSWLEKLR